MSDAAGDYDMLDAMEKTRDAMVELKKECEKSLRKGRRMNSFGLKHSQWMFLLPLLQVPGMLHGRPASWWAFFGVLAICWLNRRLTLARQPEWQKTFDSLTATAGELNVSIISANKHIEEQKGCRACEWTY